MNQLQLEQEMATTGRLGVLAAIKSNLDKGRGDENPYASAIYRRYLEGLADIIQARYMGPKGRGPASTPRMLMAGCDPQVLSYLTLRLLMAQMLPEQAGQCALSGLGRSLGSSVLGECFLSKFSDLSPAMFFTIQQDLRGRHSKSERHKLAVYRAKAEETGVTIPDWTAAERVAIGIALLQCAAEAGLVSIFEAPASNGHSQLMVMLSDDIHEVVDKICEHVSWLSPQVLPFVEQPRDWVTPNDGGYHTQEMQRISPSVVRGRGIVDEDSVPQVVLDAVNAMQRTKWKINTELLDVVSVVSRHFNVSDVVAQAAAPKPHPPSWLTPETTKATMSDAQFGEFVRWKREVAAWYSDQRTAASHRWRYGEILRVARKYSNEPFLHFMYQLDFRGRAYAQSRGVNPQGSDLQKALIHSYDGAKLNSSDAIKWFFVTGANKFGFDKAKLTDRVKWVEEHSDMIIRCANNPTSYREWTEADCPFQFLAWAMEYRDWVANPANFETRLPVSMDGSCNGLQHFSAILLDAIGGKATNLVPAEYQQDIYAMVASETRKLLETAEEDTREFKTRWAAHGINRTLVKRSVMTLPYGSTRFSCSQFIAEDYMAKGLSPEFSRDEYQYAAQWLSHYVWKAIGRVVVKALEAMQWLQKASDKIMRTGADHISWVSPVGMTVTQRYPKIEYTLVNSKLSGGVRFQTKVSRASEQPCSRSHRNGISPNFIHSCDASHMMFVVAAAKAEGMDFMAMIHDDYGVLAPYAQRFSEIIREQFIKMYQQYDPLRALCEAYSNSLDADTLPSKGDLKLTQVLDSQYFFC